MKMWRVFRKVGYKTNCRGEKRLQNVIFLLISQKGCDILYSVCASRKPEGDMAMIKKCLALLVLFAIIIGCIPLGVNAQSKSEQVLKEIRSVYSKVQRATGRTDLNGFCGTLVGYELCYYGITTWPIILDGKDQYDAFKDLKVTSGGFPIRTYSADNYTMREALYAATNGGTKDIYNVLLGFQWTNSEAGRRFGHAVFVHAILGGVMYYSESFDTIFDSGAGTPSVCTIDDFVDLYSRWSVFEGLVLFGQKSQVNFGEEYACNAFLQATKNTESRNAPSTQQSAVLRQIKRGERLEATGLYINEKKESYYRIVDSGKIAYVSAEDVKVYSMRYDDVQLQDATYPEVLKPGQSFTINGILRSTHNEVHNVTVRIVDKLGQEQDCFAIPVEGRYKDLKTSALNREIEFQSLLPGNYTLEISADVRNHQIRGNRFWIEAQQCILAEAPFVVGEDGLTSVAEMAQKREPVTGWQFEAGVWRYYEEDAFRTGWFCSKGIDYYFLEDGAAATGWQEINGNRRFFSDTGAMRTGWLDDNGAVYYLRSNGVPVTGQQTIDGEEYVFGTDGILINPAHWKK